MERISTEDVLREMGVDEEALVEDNNDSFKIKLSKRETTAMINQYLRYSDQSLEIELENLKKINFPESGEVHWFGFFMQTRFVEAIMKLKNIK